MNWERSENFSEFKGCFRCKHYLGEGTCTAYPDEIPLPIISGEVDHMVPRPGQAGDVLYEPREDV